MGMLADVKLLVLNVNLSPKNRTEDKRDPLFRKQTSLFLHGATGSGKTTMLERTAGKSTEDLMHITRTTGEETHVLGKKGDPITFVIDHGGEAHKELENSRMSSLNQLRPLAILLLLDHAPRGKEIDKIYSCPEKGMLPEDGGDPIRIRFEQHQKAISELTNIFKVSPSVGENCRLVLPIVNKRDAWESLGYSIHIFTDWYFDALLELAGTISKDKVYLHRPIPLAGKWEGFGKALNIVQENAGKELRIKLAENPWFSAIIRVPTVKKTK